MLRCLYPVTNNPPAGPEPHALQSRTCWNQSYARLGRL